MNYIYLITWAAFIVAAMVTAFNTSSVYLLYFAAALIIALLWRKEVNRDERQL